MDGRFIIPETMSSDYSEGEGGMSHLPPSSNDSQRTTETVEDHDTCN